MLAESEGEVEAEVVELATELPQDWMALEGDAALWEEEAPSAEVAAPLALKEELALEPAAELPQDWMALEGDELPLEAKAPLEALAEATLEKEPLLEPAAQEVAFEAEAAEPKEVETWEEAVFELPDWAVAGALETQVGPDWVMLTEEEEAEAHIVEGPPVSAPPTWEPVKEEPLPAVEPEAPARPTWVAAEAEPFAKAPIVKAPIVTEPTPPAIAKPKDDQGRLALARALWDSGQKKDAQAEYERLIKSPLLEDVIGDLERIATDEAVEEPVLRLLGDAYMRDNRLSEALATYRRALASL